MYEPFFDAYLPLYLLVENEFRLTNPPIQKKKKKPMQEHVRSR